MKTLHILRKTNDPLAIHIINEEQKRRPVVLLLIQDGVLSKGNFPDETYVSQEDLSARGGKSAYTQVNYPEIARLIIECDRVVTW